MRSFQNGARIVEEATGMLNGRPSPSTTLQAAAATKAGLAIARDAVGVPSPEAAARVGLIVQVNNAAPEGPAPVGGAPAGNLWATLVGARQFAAPAADPYDAPSPLPPALASR